jgi:hypothetical protein
MFEQAFKNIDDILWKEAGCTTELDYTEQTSWLLFLKYLERSGEGQGGRSGAPWQGLSHYAELRVVGYFALLALVAGRK